MVALRTCETNRATVDFGRPKCPLCGNVPFVAEETQFNLKGRIRHSWSCDECGHVFATSIVLRPHWDDVRLRPSFTRCREFRAWGRQTTGQRLEPKSRLRRS